MAIIIWRANSSLSARTLSATIKVGLILQVILAIIMGARLALLKSEAMQLSASECTSLAQAFIAIPDEDSKIEEA